MKKLIVSIKTSSQVLDDFKSALKKARAGKLKGQHFEVSFDNKKDFEKFVKNIEILMAILNYKPRSVYELSKKIHMDLSNLNKIILFFEEAGVIELKRTKKSGRIVTQPIVAYDKIEFNLAA